MQNDDTDTTVRPEGPGAIDDTRSDVASVLNGIDENSYVEIFNPLSSPFFGKVASSRPTNAPVQIHLPSNAADVVTRNADDLRRNYGVDLKNPDHANLGHFAQSIEIPAGGTVRLPGNEAQVVVRQLVNTIMSREGRKLFMGDPHARRLVEERIIIKQGSMSEFFTKQDIDVRKVLNQESEANDVDEPTFPGATEDTPTEDSSSKRATEQPVSGNRPGRPPKSRTQS